MSYCDMRTTRARYAAFLLGFGLGAFFEGLLLHPVAGVFYLVAWLICVAGVLTLWSAVRGPGPLPPGREFAAYYLVGWGVFNLLEGITRHDLLEDWPVFATGIGFVILGMALVVTHREPILERRSGFDRRSESMLR